MFTTNTIKWFDTQYIQMLHKTIQTELMDFPLEERKREKWIGKKEKFILHFLCFVHVDKSFIAA
jgi:hypothetical protein